MSKKFTLPATDTAVIASSTFGRAALSSQPGHLVVWGSPANLLVVKGTPSGEFVSLAAGGHAQTLAINADARIELHPVPDPSDPAPGAVPSIPDGFNQLEFCAVGIGRHHGLAIERNGTIRVWPPAAAADGAPTASAFVAVTGAAAFYSAALDTNGSIFTWGGSGDPAAGINPIPEKPLARMKVVPPSGRFKAIAARGLYTLALAEDGRLYGWGADVGQSGTDFNIFRGTSTTDPWTPDGPTPDGPPEHYIAPVVAGNPYTAIAAGLDVILALCADRTLVQWASDTVPPMEPPPAGVAFTQIAAGGLGLAAGIDETGTLHIWGRQPWIERVSSGVYSALHASTNHIAAIEAPRSFLWPPNHKMRTIVLTFRADENCTPVELSGLLLELRSNQPDNGFGSGNTTGDTNGQDGHSAPVVVPATAISQNSDGSFTATFTLRAERAEALSGPRVYTVAIVSADPANPAIRSTRMAAQFRVEPGEQ